MTKSMKKMITVLGIAGAILTVDAGSMGFYVGREVSNDGTMMVGTAWDGTVVEERFERGKQVCVDGTKNDYAFVRADNMVSQGEDSYGGSAINEKGVMLSTIVTVQPNERALEADPFNPVSWGGVGRRDLIDCLAGKASTAREAVEILGKTIGSYGHTDPEIYMVADTNEAWYIEVYTGYQWAAVRMPEDHVAFFGNQFNICEFNTNDMQNVMYSPRLVALAVENRFDRWKDKPDGIIDLFGTYSAGRNADANRRTYWGHHAWAPSEYPGPYDGDTYYELFFTPDYKISRNDVFELRHEIDLTNCHVLQMQHDLPEKSRCTLWEYNAQSVHAMFQPVYVENVPVPVITLFKTEFTEGPTSEVPNVSWEIRGPFDRVSLTIDKDTVYDGNTRNGEGRWRELSRPGAHRLRLTVYHGDEVAVGDCVYTSRDEGDDPAVLPGIIDFYSDFYTGFEGEAPRVHWKARDINALEIWVDTTRVLVTLEEEGSFTLSQLRILGSHIVRIVGRNVIDDAESSFIYKTLSRGAAVSSSVPLSMSVESGAAPVIKMFEPDADHASIWETPSIRWQVDGVLDSLQLTIDNVPVFVGDGCVGSGRWLDVSSLNIDELSGSHEVSLSVANAYGAVTNSFTCTCYWAEPPESPAGSEENPWSVGESVQAYTNGTGGLVILGAGATSDFTDVADVPWIGVVDSIKSVVIPDAVDVIGNNLWAELGENTAINGEAIVRRKEIAAGFPVETPSGAISPVEFERIDIVDGNAYLNVAVYTSDTLENPDWSVATNGVIEVPAEGKQGFFILQTKSHE